MKRSYIALEEEKSAPEVNEKELHCPRRGKSAPTVNEKELDCP